MTDEIKNPTNFSYGSVKLANWLKRKYPTYHNIISYVFTEKDIEEYIKKNKYQLAILLENNDNYKKGTLFLVKKSGNCVEDSQTFVWDGTYDIYGLFYCDKPHTPSGYHHKYILPDTKYEILGD